MEYPVILDLISCNNWSWQDVDDNNVKYASARKNNLEKLTIDGPFGYQFDFGEYREHENNIEMRIDGKQLMTPYEALSGTPFPKDQWTQQIQEAKRIRLQQNVKEPCGIC